MYMSVSPVCMYVHCQWPGACESQKRVSDPLGLELQAVVSSYTLNHWVTSPVPSIGFLICCPCIYAETPVRNGVTDACGIETACVLGFLLLCWNTMTKSNLKRRELLPSSNPLGTHHHWGKSEQGPRDWPWKMLFPSLLSFLSYTTQEIAQSELGSPMSIINQESAPHRLAYTNLIAVITQLRFLLSR